MGDINQDNQLNVLDITLMINFTLQFIEANECEFFSSDLNQDGVINILDILNLVNLILG